MDSTPMEPESPRAQEDRLTHIGWIATFAFGAVAAVAAYLFEVHDLNSAGTFGDFFAGMAAPLAFLWLVVSYQLQRVEFRLQRKELALQREEIGRQREETHRLADATADSAEHARRDRVFRMIEVAVPQLYELAHVIHHRWMAESFGTPDGTFSRYSDELKPSFDQGDKAIFCREINDRLADKEAQRRWEKLADTQNKDRNFAVWVGDFLSLHAEIEARGANLGDFFTRLPHLKDTARNLREVNDRLQGMMILGNSNPTLTLPSPTR
jgi:hypothetical protein